MIQEKYQSLCSTPSDINEHLPTIQKYASGCESIVEIGVRAIVSTWALLAGNPKYLLSIDITHPKDYGGNLEEVDQATEEAGITFLFKQASSLEVVIPECDLLFIDTNHTYEQLSAELKRHHTRARKYIVLHDTNLQEFPGMRQALHEFLLEHDEWTIEVQHENCHGLSILKRVC